MTKKRTRPESAATAQSSQKGVTLDLRRYVPFSLRATANVTSRVTARVYQELFGIGIAEWRVMSMLAIESNITAARVCEARSLDAAAVSRSIRNLRKRGDVAITEDTADGRQQQLKLTSQGQRLHDRIVAVALRLEQHLLRGFGAAEVEQLIGLLGRLRENGNALETAIADPKVLLNQQPVHPQRNEASVPGDIIESHVSSGKLHVEAHVGLEGLATLRFALGKYEELLKDMTK